MEQELAREGRLARNGVEITQNRSDQGEGEWTGHGHRLTRTGLATAVHE